MAVARLAALLLLLEAYATAFAPSGANLACPGARQVLSAAEWRPTNAQRGQAASATCSWKMGPKEGSVAVQEGEHKLWYRLVRPMSVSSQKGRPLVVLHGGPQVPSDYLFPLTGVEYRSVLFYDQLGCGRSDAPGADAAEYSIASSVSDLEQVLAGVGVKDFHLLGQSWGGILAYEFLRNGGPAALSCRSVILANSPSSVPVVEAEAARLLEQAGGVDAFKAAHECRLPERPNALVDAYKHAGSVWRGSGAIAGWELDASAPKLSVPALVLRGEHDFVTETVAGGWAGAFERCRTKVLDGCSHHALLEDTFEFLEVVDSFTGQYD